MAAAAGERVRLKRGSRPLSRHRMACEPTPVHSEAPARQLRGRVSSSRHRPDRAERRRCNRGHSVARQDRQRVRRDPVAAGLVAGA